MKISIIIPTLNEERTIASCIDQFDGRDVEVVVVDGGSTDRTQEIVRSREGTRLLVSEKRGRGEQMNLGSRASSGDLLLYLHADTKLPDDGLDLAIGSLSDPTVVGGRFQLGLSEDTVAYRAIAYLSTLRSKYLGITYGDQAVYVRRSAYEGVAGFPDRAIFEDSEFCAAVSRLGRFVLLDDKVISSVRRWRQSGILRTVLWMWLLRLLYACSVPDSRLRRLYGDAR